MVPRPARGHRRSANRRTVPAKMAPSPSSVGSRYAGAWCAQPSRLSGGRDRRRREAASRHRQAAHGTDLGEAGAPGHIEADVERTPRVSRPERGGALEYVGDAQPRQCLANGWRRRHGSERGREHRAVGSPAPREVRKTALAPGQGSGEGGTVPRVSGDSLACGTTLARLATKARSSGVKEGFRTVGGRHDSCRVGGLPSRGQGQRHHSDGAGKHGWSPRGARVS